MAPVSFVEKFILPPLRHFVNFIKKNQFGGEGSRGSWGKLEGRSEP